MIYTILEKNCQKTYLEIKKCRIPPRLRFSSVNIQNKDPTKCSPHAQQNKGKGNQGQHSVGFQGDVLGLL